MWRQRAYNMDSCVDQQLAICNLCVLRFAKSFGKQPAPAFLIFTEPIEPKVTSYIQDIARQNKLCVLASEIDIILGRKADFRYINNCLGNGILIDIKDELDTMAQVKTYEIGERRIEFPPAYVVPDDWDIHALNRVSAKTSIFLPFPAVNLESQKHTSEDVWATLSGRSIDNMLNCEHRKELCISNSIEAINSAFESMVMLGVISSIAQDTIPDSYKVRVMPKLNILIKELSIDETVKYQIIVKNLVGKIIQAFIIYVKEIMVRPVTKIINEQCGDLEIMIKEWAVQYAKLYCSPSRNANMPHRVGELPEACFDDLFKVTINSENPTDLGEYSGARSQQPASFGGSHPNTDVL